MKKYTCLKASYYRRNGLGFTKKILTLCSVLMLGQGIAKAQTCVTPTITLATSTAATCAGNGSIQIEASGSSNITYTVLSGATVIQGPIAPGNFASLPPGTYKVRAHNPENGGCNVDTTIVVGTTYVPFTASVSVTAVCAGNTAGTINVTTTPGSSNPLQIAYFQGPANTPDASLTYGSATTFAVPEANFGVWNVRVKDACGTANTMQITVGNPYPQNLGIVQVTPIESNSMQCIATQPNFEAWLRLESNGVWVTYGQLPSDGVLIEVFSNDDNNCTATAAELLPSYTVTKSPSSGDDKITIPRNRKLVIRMTTPCGQVSNFCYDGTANGQPDASITAYQTGCPAPPANPYGTITLGAAINGFATLPFTYSLVCSDPAYNTSGTSSTTSINIPNLPYNATYTVTFTDACNVSFVRSTTVLNPATSPLVAAISSTSTAGCTYQNGKSTVRVQLQGYFPGLSEDAVLTITSGPDAGAVGVRNSARSFFFYNLTPGATNTITLNTAGCNTSATVSFTVPTNATQLTQNISASLQQLCGGIGNINVASAYNGSGWPVVKVYKKGTATPIYEGAAGNISVNNQPAGKYYAVLEVSWNASNGCTPSNYFVASDTVEILAGGTPPVITRKASMVCEAPMGSATEGKVSLEFSGAGPFVLEYKPQSATTWTVHNSSSNGAELIGNLVVGTTYNLRITDICGAIRTDEVTIASLGVVNTVNTTQPCLNTSYVMSVPSFVNATYSWKKNGVAMTETTRQITFPSFTDLNAGEYECTIVIGGCVVRKATITLYSQFCGTPIANLNLSGNLFNDGNGLTDGKVNGTGTNAGGTIFAVLTNSAGLVLGTREVAADGTYNFGSLPAGDYKVVMSATRPASGTTMTTSVLPTNWVSTGENLGLPTWIGDDAAPDGILNVTLTTVDVTNANFGVNRRPDSYDKTLNVTGAPVVGIPVVLTTPLAGSDIEDNDGVEETWDFNPIVITSLPSNGFTLTYNGTVLGLNDTIENYNPALLSVTPTAATPVGTTTTVFTYATIDSAGVKDATPATYTIIFGSPLPIKLASFTAIAKGEAAILNWTTITEHNSKGFEIERSNSNKSWMNVGYVATKAQNGNSTDKLSYDFTDRTPQKGINYYRLRQIDNDGKATFSEERIVRFKNGNVITIYPNPTTNNVQIDGLEGTELIRMYDVTGRMVYNTTAKNVTETIQLHTLSEGTYQVTITQANGDVATHKIVKLK